MCYQLSVFCRKLTLLQDAFKCSVWDKSGKIISPVKWFVSPIIEICCKCWKSYNPRPFIISLVPRWDSYFEHWSIVDICQCKSLPPCAIHLLHPLPKMNSASHGLKQRKSNVWTALREITRIMAIKLQCHWFHRYGSANFNHRHAKMFRIKMNMYLHICICKH